MKTVTCHLCKTTLSLAGKTLDDQAEEFITAGWSEIYDPSDELICTCPTCLEQLRTGSMPPEKGPKQKS